MPAYKDRIDRIDHLEALIPRHAPTQDYPDPARLLSLAGKLYQDCASLSAQRRAIQRDLAVLLDSERIEVVNPGCKPHRYRRRTETADADPYLWDYARRTMDSLLQAQWPTEQLEAVRRGLLHTENGLGLDEDKLRIVSDNQRLLPAAIRSEVLSDVLEALACSRTLLISYRDAADKVTHPVLHPLALLQRGPRLYLFALKNDEAQVRKYALHRITSSAVGNETARAAPDFSLDTALRDGSADFGAGGAINLVLRARGYVADLLRECALSLDQRIQDEEEGSDFDLRVSATVPATGQLLRWLLGFGDKVEVLEPTGLRAVVAARAAKLHGLYTPRESG